MKAIRLRAMRRRDLGCVRVVRKWEVRIVGVDDGVVRSVKSRPRRSPEFQKRKASGMKTLSW